MHNTTIFIGTHCWGVRTWNMRTHGVVSMFTPNYFMH